MNSQRKINSQKQQKNSILTNNFNGEFKKEEFFDLIVQNFPVGLIIIDKEERVLEFNPAAQEITGFKKEEVLGKYCKNIFNWVPCELKNIKEDFSPKKTDSISSIHIEGVIFHKDGHEIPIRFTAAPLIKDNEVCGAIAIFRDVTKEKQLERHRRILISMFAHDLKGPLAIAGGLLLRMKEGKTGQLSPKQLQYVNTIIKEINKVEKYIRSFLDIVRMEAGQISLSKELCDVNTLISELLEGLELKAKEKNIKILKEIPDDLPLVYVDKEQLQRVIYNIIDNAIKYSPNGSNIIISCKDRDETILCSIEDFGPGIKKEDIPYIFDPFYRANYSENIEGTGIGLAIVKTIIEAHGGKVWVKNKQEPDHGAVFTFVLPKHFDEKARKV